MYTPVGFFAPSGPPPPPVVTRDIHAWYDAQDSTLVGTTISDLSGNGRTATAVGSPVKSIEGFFFNTSGQQINTSFNDSTLDGLNRTIEMWIRITPGVIYSVFTTVVFNGAGGAIFGMSASDPSPMDDVMRSTNGQVAKSSALPATSLKDDLYHQFVVRRAGPTISMHRDGVPYGTPGTNASVTALINKNTPFTMMGGSTVPAKHFTGTGAYLAIARFYNTNLSDAEILQNYNASVGKFV